MHCLARRLQTKTRPVRSEIRMGCSSKSSRLAIEPNEIASLTGSSTIGVRLNSFSGAKFPPPAKRNYPFDSVRFSSGEPAGYSQNRGAVSMGNGSYFAHRKKMGWTTVHKFLWKKNFTKIQEIHNQPVFNKIETADFLGFSWQTVCL